ncbi:MAG: N-acetyl-1-D-myo-inositol-2-amino-2-deoxy-alpha-D-glucopyranoside deacetylase [Trebonia sp.]
MSTGRRLLLVHAHPDDESIFTGATMARYAADGTQVTLVTCTMGERGGIAKSYPGTERQELPRMGEEDRLTLVAKIRARELQAACAALGVTEQIYLGGAGQWRDSGVRPGDDARAFSLADLDEAAEQLIAVIREVRPQVIVTYDAKGFYEHPDHIQAHRVAWRAYELACDPLRTKFYALTIPRSVLVEATSGHGGPAVPKVLEYGASDEQVTTKISADAYLGAKLEAMKAHATQITVDGPHFSVLGLASMRAFGTEYYTLLSGPGATTTGSLGHGHEEDLFAGI